MRRCGRSSDSSVEVRGAVEAKGLRTRRAELIGDVFEFVQIVRLQSNLQRRPIADSSIQVQQRLRQTHEAVRQRDCFGCIRVRAMNRSIHWYSRAVSIRRSEAGVEGRIGYGLHVIEPVASRYLAVV